MKKVSIKKRQSGKIESPAAQTTELQNEILLFQAAAANYTIAATTSASVAKNKLLKSGIYTPSGNLTSNYK